MWPTQLKHWPFGLAGMMEGEPDPSLCKVCGERSIGEERRPDGKQVYHHNDIDYCVVR